MKRVYKDNKKNATKINKPKVQALLGINSDLRTTCNVCGMTYYKNIISDKQTHTKYHNTFINGIPWPYKTVILNELTINNIKVKFSVIEKTNLSYPSQIKRIRQVLDMVNTELNASPGSKAWEDCTGGAKAFFAIINERIIGLVTTETVQEGKWMILSTQNIVPDRVKPLKLGISRIWIAPQWRRLGIGFELLKVILDNSIYGVKLDKLDIGFSQPSTSGGLLLKKFNGIAHKSGQILIPIYLEND